MNQPQPYREHVLNIHVCNKCITFVICVLQANLDIASEVEI